MKETRIKISSIVENQLPQYVVEEFPLASEFLTQYYTSLENQGGVSDILQNIDQYIKVDNLTNLIDFTTLTSDVTFFDSSISVESTAGFPESYGLLLIDSEIITYTSKTTTSFEGCVRGFSGITEYYSNDELSFVDSKSQQHSVLDSNGNPTKVTNLSVLFLKEFLYKVKKQVTPGFEDRELYSDLNERLFIKQSIDFYSSKGTDNSFKILFGALYGKGVEVIRPRDYLIEPSNAQYRITSDLVVEEIEGNPENLVNLTFKQDGDGFLNSAQGTITKVEKIRRNSRDYYVVSLDSDYNKDILPSGTVYGKFSIHPKTKLVTSTVSGSNTLDVDSTVSFPSSGNLIVNLENGTTLNITYKSKTLNQFLNCSGIDQDIPLTAEIKYDAFAYGDYRNQDTDTVEKIKVRILGVLSELNIPNNTRFYSKGDTVRIKTLGIDLKDYKPNDWFFNLSTKYEVKSVELLDSSDRSYRITTVDNHSIKVGDSVTLIPSSGVEQTGSVTAFKNQRSFSVQFGSEQSLLNESLFYIVRKNLLKVNSPNYPEVNKYTSNVQNIYYSQEDSSLYVASPSLPSYKDSPLDIRDRSITFGGTFAPEDETDLTKGTILQIGNHGLYTGDSIVYRPTPNNNLGISTGIYFIKKISDTEVKLSRSKNNIFTNNFVAIASTTVTEVKFEVSEFTYTDLTSQTLESQKLIRKISIPENDGNIYETEPGLTGIFVNGVELLNYKSKDNIYYGPIQKIIPTSPGSGYDIINPPELIVVDPIGSGVTAYCSVIGNLERIDILDPGFDYLEEPLINIKGGNGSQAKARANLISFDHQVSFNSQSSAGLVSLTPTNTIGFSTYHKFRDIEEVIYSSEKQTVIGGLVSNSSYFISVQDGQTIKLYPSFDDAVIGINTINLTSFGVGNHLFKSRNKKKKISSISIENSGENYQNKLSIATPVGINTASNIINIENHGYLSGEIVTYRPTEIAIGGLTSESSYYITKINDNQFKLSQIGISSLGFTTSFYYDTNQYINLTSSGSGLHKFNYPEIEVTVKGRIGISTLAGQNFDAEIRPVFRGQIQSVCIESNGNNYGSEDILNYNRQPLFQLSSGSGIQVKPVISDGKIVEVLVQSSGSGYNSAPNIEIIGSGSGAVLAPVFSNGTLIKVDVIYGGGGYDKLNTSINITSGGSGAKFEAQIKPWKINLVERLRLNSQLPNDDGILTNGLNPTFGLQYTHAYAPKQLRKLVQATSFVDGDISYTPDLQVINNNELTSTAHSPILGWSYDGSPIYGPYGYSSKTGGSVRLLSSSYKIDPRLNLRSDRPSLSLYPQGFFIDDYVYEANGDLDEHNGRFCVTPEYPNGIYAYFATVDNNEVGFKNPVFPYIIGPTYKFSPIEFNFRSSSNQDFIDLNQTDWRRNTTPYNLKNYDYLVNPNTIKQQNSIVNSITLGNVQNVGIITGGIDYKVNDILEFTDEPSYSSAKAKVTKVKGKEVTQISVATSSYNDVIFYPYKQEFVGFVTTPHGLSNNDLVTITGRYDYRKSGNIKVLQNFLTLTSGVGSAQYTGIVTYFNVSGNLNYPAIRENDIYQFGQEQVKVLNIDLKSSRIRVLRNFNGTVGLTTYSSGTIISEKPRKITVNFGISTSYNFDIDREIYFYPAESVGLGTLSGVGIGSTLYFSNPGVGITELVIPTKSIYIENHNLNTGDSLTYSSNGGTTISVSTDGANSFQLSNNSTIYVAKISNDLIGISTIKVGIGSTGTFVGIGSTVSGILYFTSVGSGQTHSFRTNYSNLLSAKITKNIVTVSTAQTHGLSLLDSVTINAKPGIETSITVKYDDYNRRLIINPRSFSTIDTTNSNITINNHGFYTGQKVLYTSATPASGLVNNGMYYVIVIDPDKIQLSNSYYNSTNATPKNIVISSSTSGVISPINPPVNLIKNYFVNFNLSDSSLSFVKNSVSYPAFELKLFKDSTLSREFDTTELASIFEVQKSGLVGIDSTAKLTLRLNDEVPSELYYNLVPINLDLNQQIKKDIISDSEVISNNKITIKESEYNGTYTVSEISSTSFKYNTLRTPEITSYNGGVEYYTDSHNATGSIQTISILSKGNGYLTLPGISSIRSTNGENSYLIPDSNNIGKVTSVTLQDIGFDYSSDYSVRPTARFPSILQLESLSTFDYIGISSFGRNYNTPPNLVVIDGLTNKVLRDVKLSYSLGDTNVTIERNTTELSNSIPRIIPVNNSNGIKIKNIVFNSSTKDVVVTLGASFSDPEDFPFFVGEKVLIEGINVATSTTEAVRGYNSSEYNYALFTVDSFDSKLGGIGATVTYNLSSYLGVDEVPGNFSSFYSSGKIIPQSQFPIFVPVLKRNNFYDGELVYSNNSSGEIERWDSINQYLKVSTSDDFESGDIIRGKTSGSTAIIRSVEINDTTYIVDSSSKVKKGWNRDTGFLNNDFQRIHDSNYYQYFSYDIKSQVDLNTWDNPVSTLNHTAGFKKFGNLIMESVPYNLGISTDQNSGDYVGIADFSNTINLNCVTDFDLASENNFILNNSLHSTEVIFNSRLIQDYIESIGNRVLIIDDLSEQFNSNPRSTEFSVVDSFLLEDFRSRKYIISIQDKKFVGENQLSAVSLIHNNETGFINQYGLYNFADLGSFDFSITGNTGNLLFYPNKSKFNNYNLQLFNFSLRDINTGIGTISLGDVSSLFTNTVTIPQGSSAGIGNSIVGIATTVRSSKVLVQIGSTDSSYYEYDEITYIHDNTNVYLIDYGQITTDNFNSRSTSGIGTYNAYISNGNVIIDLIPDAETEVDYVVNTLIASLSTSGFSSTGSQTLEGSSINSSSVGIASSSSPSITTITSYSNDFYNTSYLVISIEDLTTLNYQVSEFLIITNTSTNECYMTEFGSLYSDSPLGSISSGLSGDITNIYFTPNENIEVDVKVFQTNVGLLV